MTTKTQAENEERLDLLEGPEAVVRLARAIALANGHDDAGADEWTQKVVQAWTDLAKED